jgi:hypothetical protein
MAQTPNFSTHQASEKGRKAAITSLLMVLRSTRDRHSGGSSLRTISTA